MTHFGLMAGADQPWVLLYSSTSLATWLATQALNVPPEGGFGLAVHLGSDIGDGGLMCGLQMTQV